MIHNAFAPPPLNQIVQTCSKLVKKNLQPRAPVVRLVIFLLKASLSNALNDFAIMIWKSLDSTHSKLVEAFSKNKDIIVMDKLEIKDHDYSQVCPKVCLWVLTR